MRLPGKFHDGNIREAFESDRGLLMAEGGTSTYSLSGILSAVVNKTLLCVSRHADDVESLVPCRLESRLQDRVAFSNDRRRPVQEMAPSGEIKDVSLTDSTDDGGSRRLPRHGSAEPHEHHQRRHVGFQTVPKVLGRMAAIAVEKTATTALLANVGGVVTGFFSTGNKNYASGAGSVMSDTSLATAYQKFTEQTDSNGDPIMVRPSIIAVPPAETTARSSSSRART